MKEKHKFMHWLMNSTAKKDGITLENMKEWKRSDNIQIAGLYTALGGIALTFIGKFLEYRGRSSGSVEEFADALEKEAKKEEESSEE